MNISTEILNLPKEISYFVERLRFIRASLTNNDETLNGMLRESFSSLSNAVNGKNVALVGNARSLCSSRNGDAIDANDIVIRINRAPKFSLESHGDKTDWLALATSIDREHFKALNCDKLIWMSHKRKRLKFWMKKETLYLFPLELYAEIKTKLGAPPSTGLMMLFWLSTQSFASLTVYGFDFFASLSLTGSRTANQVPHDFNAEYEWFQEFVSARENVVLVK